MPCPPCPSNSITRREAEADLLDERVGGRLHRRARGRVRADRPHRLVQPAAAQDDIILDQTARAVASATVVRSGGNARAASVNRTYRVRLRASDRTSGV